MRLKITIVATVLAIGILPMQAQQRGAIKTHTEKDTRKISDGYDRVPCTETYSYYEDEAGNYVKHGSYSISGTKELKRSDYLHSLNVSTSYSAKANFKDGWLNGNVTVNMSMLESGNNKGQNFSIKTVHSYIGNYSDGHPHGSWTFKTTQNGKVTRNILVNFKNGLLAGSYYSYIDGDELKGQFDANGQMNGDWARNDNFRNDTKSKYIKGLQLSSTTRDSSGKVTKSTDKEETQFATLYANGGISEEELNAKSCYIIDRSTSFSDMYREFYADILNLKVIGGYKIAVGSEEEKANLTVQFKAITKFEMLTDELIEAIMMYQEFMPWSDELKAKYSQYRLDHSVRIDRETGMLCFTYTRVGDPNIYKLHGTEEQLNRIKDMDEIKKLKSRNHSTNLDYKILQNAIRGNNKLANVFAMVYNKLNVYNLEKLHMLGEAVKSMKTLMPRINYSSEIQNAYWEYYKDINNYDDAISFITKTELHDKIEDDVRMAAEKLEGVQTQLKEEERNYGIIWSKINERLINQIEAGKADPSRSRTLSTIREIYDKNNVKKAYDMVYKSIAIETPGLENYDNAVKIIEVAKIRNRVFESGYVLSHYDSLASMCVDVESSLKFFSFDFDLYDKYFNVNRLYSKVNISYEMLFKDVLKAYKNKYIINAFTIFWNNSNENDSELRHKILDILIEIHSKDKKNAEKLAKKITTYDEAVDFFLNKALDSCAK